LDLVCLLGSMLGNFLLPTKRCAKNIYLECVTYDFQ
jgi:hypothetical protein